MAVRGPHDALCDVLSEEIWTVVRAATPAGVPDEVWLACLGEVVLRAAALVAHRQRCPVGLIVGAFCGGLFSGGANAAGAVD